ncbi:MAG: hypothetical protein KDC92_00065 [Bacteroidetes bacterium]|nr:hypothetical protein [Bacteroidota bacterium]
MIQIFKTNHPAVFISLLLLAIVVRLGGFFNPDFELITASMFKRWAIISSEISTGYVFTWLIINVLASWVAAIVFNNTLTNNGLAARSSFTPAAFFIISSGLVPFTAQRVDLQLGVAFLVISFNRLIGSNENENPDERIFFSGVFLMVAALFTPWAILFLLLNMLTIVTSYTKPARLVLLNLLGFLITYFLIWTGFVAFNSGYDFNMQMLNSFSVDAHYAWPTLAIATILVICILLFISGSLAVLASQEFLVLSKRVWYRYLLLAISISVVVALITRSYQAGSILTIGGFVIAVNKLLVRDKLSWWSQFIFLLLLLFSVMGSFEFYNEFMNEYLPSVIL